MVLAKFAVDVPTRNGHCYRFLYANIDKTVLDFRQKFWCEKAIVIHLFRDG